MPDWIIQKQRAFSCPYSIWINCLIYSLFVVILTKAFKWLGGRWCGCVSLGPGFDPQVHPNVSNIFPYRFPCRHPQSILPCASIINLPCVLKHKSEGREWMTMILSSQCMPGQVRKSTGLEPNGPGIASIPPSGPNTPRVLFLIFPLLYFLFNYFLLTIIIIIIII